MHPFLSSLWRGLLLTVAGALWFFCGTSGSQSRLQPILFIITFGVSFACVLMVVCDRSEMIEARKDLRCALITMSKMRRSSSELIRHTPPGGTRRVEVPKRRAKARSGQSRPQSEDVSSFGRLNVFKIPRWGMPRACEP